MRLAAEPLAQRPQQPRLADAGLARQQHHLALAVLGRCQRSSRSASSCSRPTSGVSALAVQRLEPAFGATLAHDPRRRATGSAKPLSRRGPRSSSSNRPPTSRRVAWLITTLPGAASACSRAARFGVSPTTACSCAAPSPTSSPTTTSPVAIPTRGCQRARPPGATERSADRLDDRQAGPDRALGLVLVRLRPAEVGEHAVAHVLGDVAPRSADHPGAAFLVGADHLAHVLGIEPADSSVEPTRSHEHHRQLAPLGLR